MPSNEPVPVPVKAKVQESLNISTMMIVAAVLLFAVWVAYSQGWFGPWTSSTEVEGTRVGDSQMIDQEETNAVKLSRETAPAEAATK